MVTWSYLTNIQKSYQRGCLIKSILKEPPHIKCSICKDDGLCSNNIFSKNYDNDFSDYLDCILYLKKRKSLMKKLSRLLRVGIPILLMSIGLTNSPNNFRIEMLNERNYPMSRKGDVYRIKISDNHQTIFKMKAVTNSNKTERVTWSTNKSYRWSNGMVTDFYPLVNPTSYTKNGLGYSMVGFLGEMKNSEVVIYGHYQNQIDSIKVIIR